MQAISQQSMPQSNARTVNAPGIILIVATLLELLAMAHHPTVQSSDISEAVLAISRFGTLSAVVHGILISLMLLIAHALVDFAARRGLHRQLVRAGAIAYGCGILLMIGAAMVSGFIVPSLAALLPHLTPIDLQIDRQLLILCRVLNQWCANVAVVAMSAGIVCWSLDLCADAGLRRAVGLFGLAAGLVPAMALLLGGIHLDVHGMTLVVAVQAAWNLAIALLLIRRDQSL